MTSDSPAAAPPAAARRWADVALALGVALLALVAYLYTVHPSFGWGDTSELTTAAYFLGIGHSPGYPLWMLLMYPFAHLPLGSVALRLNIANAVLGAVALALLYPVCRELTKSRTAAVVALLCLAFSQTYWDLTTEADVFTLQAMLMVLILLSALRWRRDASDKWLWVTAWLVGLGFANHPLTIMLVPGLLYLVWAERGWRYFTVRHIAAVLGFGLLGLALYVYLPLRGMADPPPHVNNPHTLRELWMQLTAPGARHTMFDASLAVVLSRAWRQVLQLRSEFGTAGSLLALVGVAQLWRQDRRLLVLLGSAGLLDFLYAINFSVFDQYMYYLPLYLVWAVFVASGAAVALEWGGRAMARVARIGAGGSEHIGSLRRYGVVTVLLLIAPALLIPAHLRRVYRGDDDSAERYARAALAEVTPGSALLGDWWAMGPIGYLKHVEGVRTDVATFPAASLSDDARARRYTEPAFLDRYPAVYFSEVLTDRITLFRRAGCLLVPEGPVYRVYARRPAPETVLAKSAPTDPLARFGDQVALTKVELAPGPLRPWEPLDLTLYWTPLPGYRGAPYDVTLTLRKGEAATVWVETVRLGHGLYPFASWRPGQVLREPHRIYLEQPEEPGEYELLARVRGDASDGKVVSALSCTPPRSTHAPSDYIVGKLTVAPPSPLKRP